MNGMMDSRRNVGIFAHVDAGKTTTTEHILYASGRIRSLGSVDQGTTQTDRLDVERERGISVRAAMTAYRWNDVTVNVVDTPGHVDFLSEVERSMRVIDGAVLIVSAVEGVQAQTETIWHALRTLRVPTVLYINKMDRVGADAAAAVEAVRRELSPRAVPVQVPQGAEAEFRGSADLFDNAVSPGVRRSILEQIAECDDELLERYVEGAASEHDRALWMRHLAGLSRAGSVFPLLFGASGKGIGIVELMDAIADYLPPPRGDADAPVSGVVFKIERDKTMGRLAYVRLYNGTIRNRDTVRIANRDVEEKVAQIRKIDGRRSEDAGWLEAGDMAALCGLHEARIGDVLGTGASVPESAPMAVPLLTVQALWDDGAEEARVAAALLELAEEDPLLDVQWMPEERELHLKVTGPVQLQILSSLLAGRFHLNVTFGEASIIYKETPRQAAEGYIAYTMPKPCWAVLRFRIEPGPRGSGLAYSARVRTEDLLEQYQNEVKRRVPEALAQGLRGWEVTDLSVALVEGQHHVWHTHPLDFAVATPMGIMNGLAAAGTKLLEPVLRFRLTVPEPFGGRVMNDLAQMRASFGPPSLHGERMTIEGKVPAATSLDYPVRLASLTKGKGTIALYFDGYEECPEHVAAERPRRGVNPLDQSRYILAVRKAIASGRLSTDDAG